jgi:hypothetical protein|tara:strand:+ start:115 stop:444 length:330 start_codon:yes stop_codon:yes gene_type:complete
MANTFVWKINDLQRDLSDGFCHTAHWTLVGISDQVDADNNPYNDSGYGSIGLDRPDTLLDFEDLTEADIVAAVQAKLGAEKVTKYQNQLAARIAEKITPTQASGRPSSW